MKNIKCLFTIHDFKEKKYFLTSPVLDMDLGLIESLNYEYAGEAFLECSRCGKRQVDSIWIRKPVTVEDKWIKNGELPD